MAIKLINVNILSAKGGTQQVEFIYIFYFSGVPDTEHRVHLHVQSK